MAIRNIGTTFDIDYAQSLSLEPKDTLQRIIDLGLSPIRIGIKWNSVEQKQDEYQWERYDSVIQQLADNDVQTILTVGIKSPRWPEYYIPTWVDWKSSLGIFPFLRHKLVDKQRIVRNVLFPFLQKVINRYKGYRSIILLQVENEPFFRFGPDRISISNELLNDELNYIRKVSNRPILLTTQGLPTTGLFAEYVKNRNRHKKRLAGKTDVIGLNVFQALQGKDIFGRRKIFQSSERAWGYLGQWVEKINSLGKECIITELQAEPWESNIDYTDPYAHKTCNPDIVKNTLERIVAMNVKTVLLWGTEFHLACEREGNPQWIEKIY